MADEPTASLDDENKEAVLEIIRKLNREGMTVVLASHDKTVYKDCNFEISLS